MTYGRISRGANCMQETCLERQRTERSFYMLPLVLCILSGCRYSAYALAQILEGSGVRFACWIVRFFHDSLVGYCRI